MIQLGAVIEATDTFKDFAGKKSIPALAASLVSASRCFVELPKISKIFLLRIR